MHALVRFCFFVIAVSLSAGCSQSIAPDTGERFSFVFMTDVHLKPDSFIVAEFDKVLDTIHALEVDFVISGGDQVYDVMRGNVARSDSLFQLYKAKIAQLNIPVYNCVGNHDLFGIYPESEEHPSHVDYKYGMFERYFGNTYYSFSHKGWYFIVLNSLDVAEQRYYGRIGEEQLEWLRKGLSAISPDTPIVVTLHLPLVSVINQIYPGSSTAHADSAFIQDRDLLLDVFKDHNLRLVLQGHLHWFEDIDIGSTRFVTGAAVAGRPSWRGEHHGPRRFLVFDIEGDDIDYRFIHYGR